MKSAAITIILNDNRDQVLLIKRRDVPAWVMPGGGIETDEKPENAATREAFEETGLKVEIVRKTGEYTPLNKLAALTHVYECLVVSGKPEIGDETSQIGFFSFDNLPKTFLIVHLSWLNDALKNKTVVKRPITEVTYFKLLKYSIRHPYLVFRTLLSRLGFPIN
jgi:8-oxo-dGTP pyrophosphatase MutT (NUDIX family)